MKHEFQRARTPEEKEVRRQALLGTARALMAEVGHAGFSLNELARRSGVSKPNVYRYFESREDVLLQVWIEELRALGDRLEAAFRRGRDHSDVATAKIVARTFEAQPLLCELLAIVVPVIERNLSLAATVRSKRELAVLMSRIAGLLHSRLPRLSLADCAWAAGSTAMYVMGLWPSARPSIHEQCALAEVPELAAMQPSFRRDLERFLRVLFAGVGQTTP